MDVKINNKEQNIQGFFAKEGFILFEKNNEIAGISSGWQSENELAIYTKENENWKMDWYDNHDEFPIEKAINLQEEWYRDIQYKEAIKETEEKDDLYIGDSFTITDVEPGEKSNNGGEYGFYSRYEKTDTPGVYEFKTFTTCDFDPCGTGWEGFVTLTNDEVEKLMSEKPLTPYRRDENVHEINLDDLEI